MSSGVEPACTSCRDKGQKGSAKGSAVLAGAWSVAILGLGILLCFVTLLIDNSRDCMALLPYLPCAVLSTETEIGLIIPDWCILSRVPRFVLGNSEVCRPFLHWIYLCVYPLYQDRGCIQVCCPVRLCWWLHSMGLSLSGLCVY